MAPTRNACHVVGEAHRAGSAVAAQDGAETEVATVGVGEAAARRAATTGLLAQSCRPRADIGAAGVAVAAGTVEATALEMQPPALARAGLGGNLCTHGCAGQEAPPAAQPLGVRIASGPGEVTES